MKSNFIGIGVLRRLIDHRGQLFVVSDQYVGYSQVEKTYESWFQNLRSFVNHDIIKTDQIKQFILPRQRSYRTTNYRSEEHTSELQSRENLVCRLLLEKTK